MSLKEEQVEEGIEIALRLGVTTINLTILEVLAAVLLGTGRITNQEGQPEILHT